VTNGSHAQHEAIADGSCRRGPDDAPAFRDAVTSPPLVMALRSAEMLKAPPIDWDGVFAKTSK
jgi:hypothetical protein